MSTTSETALPTDSFFTDELARFAEERGLEHHIIEAAGLYYDTESLAYRGMLAIPYQKRNGGVWQTRYKTGHDKPKYLDEPGANLHLYNPQHLGPHSPVVWWCEGEIDTLVMWQLGFPAIGMSGNTKYGHALFQQALVYLFREARQVCITDNDDAGEVAHQDLIKAFGPKVERYTLDPGFDVNDQYLQDPELFKKELDAWRK